MPGFAAYQSDSLAVVLLLTYLIMNTEARVLSGNFQRLYCDPAAFENFSAWHPIRFTRVLPFQPAAPVMDDPRLLAAETEHLANPIAANRLAVVDALGLCGLLSAEDAANLKSELDFFGPDFFELMGEIYSNAGMFICALRWHREYIAVLETQTSAARSDREDVYADAGYCLYSLGLFAEAIAWTKSCIGPDLAELTVGGALTNYQAQLLGGRLLLTERATNRTRYTATTTQAPEPTRQNTQRLTMTLKTAMPFQETYIDWIAANAAVPPRLGESYPFKGELDNGCLPRHKMNLLFAMVAQADYLTECGNKAEASRLLQEAALLEPKADFIHDRLKAIA